MPRGIRVEEVDNYGNNNDYLSLKDDGDKVEVRFPYNALKDVENDIFIVHKVKVGGYDKYINCLRESDEPIEGCPMCDKGSVTEKKVHVKFLLHVYDMQDKTMKLWDRGKKEIKSLKRLCKRYNPLVSSIFEIERDGKKNDSQTEYDIDEIDYDKTEIQDLPKFDDFLGTYVIDPTFEEMEDYVYDGVPMSSMESQQQEKEESLPRRRSNRNSNTDNNRRNSRQTPARRNSTNNEESERGDREERSPRRGVDERPQRRNTRQDSDDEDVERTSSRKPRNADSVDEESKERNTGRNIRDDETDEVIQF